MKFTLVLTIEQNEGQIKVLGCQVETRTPAEQFIDMVEKEKVLSYASVYRRIHALNLDLSDFEGILSAAIRAGTLVLRKRGEEYFIGVPMKKE